MRLQSVFRELEFPAFVALEFFPAVPHHAMSALGQKRTYTLQQAMSALLPIATTKADMCQWSCLVHPRKQKCAVH